MNSLCSKPLCHFQVKVDVLKVYNQLRSALSFLLTFFLSRTSPRDIEKPEKIVLRTGNTDFYSCKWVLSLARDCSVPSADKHRSLVRLKLTIANLAALQIFA